MGCFLALCYGIACYALAMGALLYLFGFLGSVLVPKSIDSGVPVEFGEALVIDVTLLTSFGVLHSVMARPRFKMWWTRIVPRSVERSTFVLVDAQRRAQHLCAGRECFLESSLLAMATAR